MSLSKAIVTVAEGAHAPMLELALPTFKHYAERFGYEVVVGSGDEAAQAGRPGPWRKVPLIRESLRTYDLVLWLDTDVMILDAGRDIADELGAGDYQALVEQVSGDGRIPNTGVWLLRAGQRAQDFLEATWNEVDYIDHMWTDQAAAVTALGYELPPWLPDASLARPCERRRETRFFPGTRLLPNEWNSLFFWLPAERPRFNHHAGGWPLERRVQSMREDARRLPYHPAARAAEDAASEAPTEGDGEGDRRYRSIERELSAVLGADDEFVVADHDHWRPASPLASRGRPFPERDGAFMGCPADDDEALRELERERERGVRIIAFVWPMLWWFDSYPVFRRHLRRRYRCLVDTADVVAFDLQDVVSEADAEEPGPFDGMQDPDGVTVLPAPTGKLAEALAEIAAARPEFVVQLGLEDWAISVAIVHAAPYTGLWGFGGHFETRERCRRLAYANGAAPERVKLQHRCETSWIAAMADTGPVIVASRGGSLDLLDRNAAPGLDQCTLLLGVSDTPTAAEAARRFPTHDAQPVRDEADLGGSWVLLRPQTELSSPAATAEDHLERLAEEVRAVRFLHIGAHDGVSNERLERFIRQKGWRGVFVEPLSGLLSTLRDNYRDVEGLAFENSAVAEEDGERLFFEVVPRPGMPDWVNQFSSLRKDVILAHADAVPGLEECIVERRVPCVTVETLVGKHSIGALDLIVVDTEGYDYEVLRQLDLDTVRPRVIIYEDKHLTLRDRHAAGRLLTSAGYAVRKSGLNDRVAVLEQVVEERAGSCERSAS